MGRAINGDEKNSGIYAKVETIINEVLIKFRPFKFHCGH